MSTLFFIRIREPLTYAITARKNVNRSYLGGFLSKESRIDIDIVIFDRHRPVRSGKNIDTTRINNVSSVYIYIYIYFARNSLSSPDRSNDMKLRFERVDNKFLIVTYNFRLRYCIARRRGGRRVEARKFLTSFLFD